MTLSTDMPAGNVASLPHPATLGCLAGQSLVGARFQSRARLRHGAVDGPHHAGPSGLCKRALSTAPTSLGSPNQRPRFGRRSGTDGWLGSRQQHMPPARQLAQPHTVALRNKHHGKWPSRQTARRTAQPQPDPSPSAGLTRVWAKLETCNGKGTTRNRDGLACQTKPRGLSAAQSGFTGLPRSVLHQQEPGRAAHCDTRRQNAKDGVWFLAGRPMGMAPKRRGKIKTF
jgi:hypothetical protein